MIKLSSFILACALLTPAALLAADFEGKVRFKITTGKTAQDMDYSVKNGLARIDVQTKETTASVIMDPAKQEVTVLMLEQKMYMVQSIAGKDGAAANAGIDTSQTSFEKTSTTEKILGYDCTKYIAKSKDSTSEIWATEELGAFMGTGPGGGGGFGGRRGGGSAVPQAWEAALAGKNFFPLRVVSQNSGGKETTRMEATAVEKKSIPDSEFAPPAGFQKFDMGAMMRGMLPGR
ncbi:MAG: DUF4412 domain-containing protein [Undibacterium sp.]|nr:DUF4412 domain-containing protein [Opitutaceae bacterium]